MNRQVIFEKKGKGHNIYIHNQWVMWVVGSKKNAKKELKTEYGI